MTIRSRSWSVAVAAAVAATVSASCLDHGGFTAGSQRLLLGASAAALTGLLMTAPDELARAARSPVICVLLALGAMTMLSSIWTIGSPSAAVRSSLVILALASLAAAGRVLAVWFGPLPVAVLIGALAVAEAVVGLIAAGLHSSPAALFLNGSWRPAGTFEYPPALALLEVGALPIAIRAAVSRSRSLAGIGVLALALAGATLGAADSRMDLGLALATLAATAVWPGTRGGLRRRQTLAAFAVIAAAGVAGALLVGRHALSGPQPGDVGRLVTLAATCAALIAVWPWILARAARIDLRRLLMVAAVALAVGGAAYLSLGYASTLTSTRGGVGHGRISYWKAGVDAWEQRPLIGSGANTFFKASARYQAANDATVFAHNLPLELAVELGVAGLLGALALYASVGSRIWRAISLRGTWLLAPLAACFLIDNLVDWSWHLTGLAALWAVATGAIGPAAERTRPLAVNRERGPASADLLPGS